jgi:hypothetical protein
MRARRGPSRAHHSFVWLVCPVLLSVATAAACGADKSGVVEGADTGGSTGDDATSNDFDATFSPPSLGDDAPARVTLPDVDLPDVPMTYQAYDGALANAPGGCKAGHYAGGFSGTYSSFITVLGIPLNVSGTVSLDVSQSSNGEFFTISNGHVSGVANGNDAGGGIPYWCDVVGTLNCKTKRVEHGGLRNCAYCIGIADIDAGTCLGIEGKFEGPATADYDSSIHAFVNGTWAASEVVDGAGPVLVSDAGDSGAGCTYGLFTYGGCGTWSAKYVP